MKMFAVKAGTKCMLKRPESNNLHQHDLRLDQSFFLEDLAVDPLHPEKAGIFKGMAESGWYGFSKPGTSSNATYILFVPGKQVNIH